jgi:hypothetical protein
MFAAVLGAVPLFKLSASNSPHKASVVFLSLVIALHNQLSFLLAFTSM